MKCAFPPIVNSKAKLLILGSMPGEASLAAGQYYAFGRNAFWRIIETVFEMSEHSSYRQRTAALQKHHIALWDVIERCKREGSLDSDIEHETVIANDFETFLATYPKIQHIIFNGKSVQQLFKRHVLRKQTIPADIEMQVLPSTSPANAGLTFEQKLKAWSAILE